MQLLEKKLEISNGLPGAQYSALAYKEFANSIKLTIFSAKTEVMPTECQKYLPQKKF